jgi:hypothetical protein
MFFLISSNGFCQDIFKSIFGKSFDEMTAAMERQTLKGIEDVYIVIEKMSPSAQRLGIDEDRIRSDVEIRIRRAGIKVKEKGSLVMFYVNVCVTNDINKFYGISTRVEVKDMVSLLRDPNIKFQTTIWDTGTCAIAGEYSLMDMVRGVRPHIVLPNILPNISPFVV